ncbi:MAG TPA: hypothetical protein VIQ51_10710 [Chryseosolibacter sp.]
MNKHTHLKSDTTSFASNFLLLVMVAGVLTIDLFESDAVADYSYHRALYGIELVFNAKSPSQSRVFSIFDDVHGNDVVEGRTLPSYFFATHFGTALLIIQSTGQVNTRPFYSSHNHTRSFNIPHQNSDEDEAIILPVDVA